MQKTQSLIGFRWRDFNNFRSDNVFCLKRITVHAGLKVSQRSIVRHNSTAQSWLETARHQENAIIETAFEPGIVVFHELACLALNIDYESRGEPLEGQYAVAEVTMNRVADRRYPNTVCEAVYQAKWDYLRKRYVGAFSWTELDDNATPHGDAWARAVNVAELTFSGRRDNVLDGAVHYHADYIRPSWSRGKKPVARIGQHLFYK